MSDLNEAVVRLERACIAGMDEEYRDDLRTVLDALSAQPAAGSGGDAPIDVTDPWRGLYKPEGLIVRAEWGDVYHPDTPSWPDDREEALDKLVHAQGFDFHIVTGEFSDEAMEDGDELYWQEMRAWNPQAPEGDWRLAWKGDTEDGPYAWFVRPMALRLEPEAIAELPAPAAVPFDDAKPNLLTWQLRNQLQHLVRAGRYLEDRVIETRGAKCMDDFDHELSKAEKLLATHPQPAAAPWTAEQKAECKAAMQRIREREAGKPEAAKEQGDA
ncbi:hypothetical protein ACW0US_07290 [Xanthomonas euvesicatoria]